VVSSKNKNGYTGIAEYRNKWKTNMVVDGENIVIGIFSTRIDAAKMYCKCKSSYEFSWSLYGLLTVLVQNFSLGV